MKFFLDVLDGKGQIGVFRYAPLIGPDILTGILSKVIGQSVLAFAKEEAQAVRDWAFTHTTFGLVYSYMKKANTPSSATARANGMTLLNEFIDDEGEQTVVYGIRREEWQNQKMSKEIGK